MMNVGILYADCIGNATCFYVLFALVQSAVVYDVYNCKLISAYVFKDLGHVYDCLDGPEISRYVI